MRVPSSGIIDLAVGLTFVFGVTAALSSVVTELIARFLGLRAAYLLIGLRELVDPGNVSTDLRDAEGDYHTMHDMIRGVVSAGEPPAYPPRPWWRPFSKRRAPAPTRQP